MMGRLRLVKDGKPVFFGDDRIDGVIALRDRKTGAVREQKLTYRRVR